MFSFNVCYLKTLQVWERSLKNDSAPFFLGPEKKKIEKESEVGKFLGWIKSLGKYRHMKQNSSVESQKNHPQIWRPLGFHMASAFILYSPLICPTVSRPLQRSLCPLSAASGNIIAQHRRMLSWYIYIEEVNAELWSIFFFSCKNIRLQLIWWPINPHSHKGSSFRKLASSICNVHGSGCSRGGREPVRFQCSRWNIKRNL